MSKYSKIKDYEPTYFDWRDTTLRFACCDCGLVHDWVFRPNGAKSFVLLRRMNRSTAQLRRHGYGNLHSDVGKWRLK
jgi:hypothetical protein